jgi:starch synthase (maltosyl-transferring)
MGRCVTPAAGAGDRVVRAASAGPRILYLHHSAGGLEPAGRLASAARLGFDHVCLQPFCSRRGSPLLVADWDQPTSGWASGTTALDAVRVIADRCRDLKLGLAVDLVLDRVAAGSAAATAAGGLFAAAQIGPADPRLDPGVAQAALVRSDRIDEVASWWATQARRLLDAGACGFRLLGLDHLPDGALAAIVRTLRAERPDMLWGWAPGLPWSRHRELAVGLDGIFASTAWWDGRAAWYAEELQSLGRYAPLIGVAGVPWERRVVDPQERRRRLRLAAATCDGVFVPEGLEGGLEDDFPALLAGGSQSAGRLRGLRRLTGSSAAVTVLARFDTADPRQASCGAAVLINNDRLQPQPLPVSLDPLDPAAGASLRAAPGTDRDLAVPLAPGEVRVVALAPIVLPERSAKAARLNDRRAARAAAQRSPVVIERVSPQVAGGFAARRIIGRPVTVEADIFADGHDVLAAELMWRAVGDKDWQRAPLVPLGNDRWRGSMMPQRIGRHVFTIEAWRDEYGTLLHALEVKHRAGVDLVTDLADAVLCLRRLGCGAIADEMATAEAGAAVHRFAGADVRKAVAGAGGRPFATQHAELPLEVERPQAGFASWYELFPRSLGTFDDVIAHLPRVRDMGFDVLYFPPIHPIGTAHRKGRNNALTAAPGDPGSPYAIGAAEGGHDALHSELGTFEDFRRLVAAAAEHGLEIALDFAIQCSPDHPWLTQHPEWFRRRADGTIRYAENPPKKYEDIVNVDFYAEAAIPDLWLALRDVVLHWIGHGVRIFRVDNPHTKPLPFWEWMIGDVRARHPDAIFLAEAFTRPAMMYRLGKIGFTQSYTYFTWRNTKAELTDYLRELTTTEPAEFYRPHFFVNTPDINPYFLQGSGRAGFLIRAALAATLSGLWGVYSGFEVCEAAALPGREEYLDSEKYEVRRRDFAAPGNIVAEISALNRLRRLHPALHSHLGVRFYNAFNDQVMVYGKPTPAPGNTITDMILVAVSLDPHRVQEATFEVPLWEWNLPDDGSVHVEDLMHGTSFVWKGKLQTVRLDPTQLPFAIWRIAPAGGPA